MKRLCYLVFLISSAAAWSEEAHWAFQPLRGVTPPAVGGAGPVDAFLVARLEQAGLAPSAEADRNALIRRASFDLTGLPPSPEEISAFIDDTAPDAWAKLVDRLLASPRYGERWGRYWLDLVRYADSNGVDENYNHPNAWRYRDYVVRAFNHDTPYDEFLTEQIAGDLLEGGDDAQRSERIIATGMLTLGPKILAEQDHEKLRMDAVDEMLDTLTLTTLGLSIGCARCHDHKFDPIPTRDYYAMAGIFRSTEFLKKKTENTFVTWEAPIYPGETERRKQERGEQIARLEKDIQHLRDNPGAGDSSGKLDKLKKELKQLKKSGVDVPTTMTFKEAQPRDLPIHIRGSHLELEKDKIPRGFPSLLDHLFDPPAVNPKRSGRLELAQWITDPKNPLTARVMANRIWQGHFSHGLVRTPSNFGLKGEAPTHPELLDWLARAFIDGGWSIKHLHRLILNSKAYRMSSADRPAARAKDPENRLLWRQHRRRLEAEPLRDALLSVAGNLDRSLGGKLELKNAGADYYKGDDTDYDSNRRSIYLPAIRNKTYEMFTIFDHAEMSTHQGKRSATTVPHQSLFMMNSPWVMQQAEDLAGRVAREAGSDAERLHRLYLLLFARPPKAPEAELVTGFLGRFENRQAGWTRLCHTLLASNEFIFIP